jgi:N-acetylmuramic acid 6-phosphate etherase
MSNTSDLRSDEFLRICDQFQLGQLTTEGSHPVTARLSQVAQEDIARGLQLLFEADKDVIETYRRFIQSGRAAALAGSVLGALKNGGRIFFTGCGSTGRLSIQLVSIWRDFWQRQAARGAGLQAAAQELEPRALAAMAGGDYALIKAVEGFEDFTAFGRKQMSDLGVGGRDVVFAITEGGETSFVIGTAWQGVEAGAKVCFVYNNPDEILCQTVQRSREVIADARIEKLNLTTGPMAITGSTRMQATTIQLAVLLTVLEIVVRELLRQLDSSAATLPAPADVPAQFLGRLVEIQATLSSPAQLSHLFGLVALEEATYRAGGKNNYFADHFAIDVLTDTTERSPTYCTPPFRKFDDATAAESWAFLFVPDSQTPKAWKRIIKRTPVCVQWTPDEVRKMVDEDKVARTCEIIRKIGYDELMRFRVGLDGLEQRPLSRGDVAVGIVSQREQASLLDPGGFHRTQLESAHQRGARIGLLYLGAASSFGPITGFLSHWRVRPEVMLFPVPETDFLLDGLTRVALKMILNALSTCTMVRLGRVMGNYMIWVVPSNLKLIDRATRYIESLTKLSYKEANRLLFEAIEYVEPRMKTDQAYPPVVGLCVLRASYGLTNRQAEARLSQELAFSAIASGQSNRSGSGS